MKPIALIIDDSSVSRAILSKMLNKCGVETHEVTNGSDGLIKLRGMNYTVIFLDLEMPVMGGEETAARIRALGYTGPIVVATGNVVKGGDTGRLQNVGVTETLTKPITRQMINNIVGKYIPDLKESTSTK
ncbi:hypothetical protein HDV05_000757 [Chytridiales sp. JEL 0842]|nr:hypothetical protein HDV05_000757 [Chytridiales sp. JEL 0842]